MPLTNLLALCLTTGESAHSLLASHPTLDGWDADSLCVTDALRNEWALYFTTEESADWLMQVPVTQLQAMSVWESVTKEHFPLLRIKMLINGKCILLAYRLSLQLGDRSLD